MRVGPLPVLETKREIRPWPLDICYRNVYLVLTPFGKRERKEDKEKKK
jgi:hypothetical protein